MNLFINFTSGLCLFFSDQKASSSEWKEVKSFLTANDHLKGVDRGKYAPKSGLEKKVDNAIQQGDFETAEKLSDKLANREVKYYCKFFTRFHL